MVAIAEYMVGGVWGFILALFGEGFGCLEVLCFRYDSGVIDTSRSVGPYSHPLRR